MAWNRIRRFLKREWGFTLIEVLMILALLGSATALAAPNVMEALDGSEDKADAAQMDYLLASFQMHQAPFNDEHTSQYDLLKPDNVDYTMDADGTITNVEIKAGAAVETLNLFLQDAILDSGSEVYIEGVQCVTTEQSSKAGKPIFQAEESGGMLYIICMSGDGNRSNAEIRIPGIDHISYGYSTGEQIRWGDSLLYIGDYENLESRFAVDSCQDYQMEAGFYLDNHIHQAGDHKSHMGLVFNYMDDENFCLIDLELKNGTKKMAVYQVVDGVWSELEKNIGISHDFNLPGNKDYSNDLRFKTRMTVWNSVAGTTTVKLEMAQEGIDGGSYDEIFTADYSIADEKKSSQYAFYIGEPAGNQLKQDGVIIGYKDFDDEPVDPEDPSTYEYENVQIQLLAYPTFICEGEDGTFNPGGGSGSEEPTSVSVTGVDFTSTDVTPHFNRSLESNETVEYRFYKTNGSAWSWDSDSSFSNNTDKTKVEIRILRSGSVVYGPHLFEKEAVGASYGQPSFVYNYNNDNQPITIVASDSQFDVEYRWNEGLSNSSMPSQSTTADYSSDLNQYSPHSLGSKTGWLWAREYDETGHGEWTGTPWVGRNQFDNSDLTGTMTSSGYEVSYNGSLSGMVVEYLGGSNGSWHTNKPILSSNTQIVQARVMYNGEQISYTISGSNFNVPESPVESLLVEVKIRYQNKNFSYVTFTTSNDCSISYQTDKEGPRTATKNIEIQLARSSSWIDVSVVYEGTTKTLSISNLNSNTYTVE